jgi:hypothetical protein
MPNVIDYTRSPLGSQPGEAHLQAPYNQRAANVLVKVRNLSAIKARMVIEEYVSFRRGGSKQLNDTKRKQEFYGNSSVDELRMRVANGENLNWEVKRVEPIDFVIRHDSLRYLIPALDADGKPAPWINVEPGVWDLYMGNYWRIHSKDQRERIDELQLLNSRNLYRYAYAEDDQEERPYAFLEFHREEIKIADVVVDTDRVSSGKLIEV